MRADQHRNVQTSQIQLDAHAKPSGSYHAAGSYRRTTTLSAACYAVQLLKAHKLLFV